MDKGTQVEVPLAEVLDKVIAEVGTETLSFYHPSRDWIITDTPLDQEKMNRVTVD